jgi:hypothetical protein
MTGARGQDKESGRISIQDGRPRCPGPTRADLLRSSTWSQRAPAPLVGPLVGFGRRDIAIEGAREHVTRIGSAGDFRLGDVNQFLVTGPVRPFLAAITDFPVSG